MVVLAVSASKIWSITGPTRTFRPRSHANQWGTCTSLVLNPAGYYMAAVACENGVYLTFNLGLTWSNAQKNLLTLMGAKYRTFPKTVLIVSLDSLNQNKLVLCGTYNGVYALAVDVEEFNAITDWTRLGTTADLPLVPVRHLFYQRAQDVLYTFTFGRGTYSLAGAMSVMRKYRKTGTGGTFPPACPVPRARPNAFINAYYTAFPIPATPVLYARCFSDSPVSEIGWALVFLFRRGPPHSHSFRVANFSPLHAHTAATHTCREPVCGEHDGASDARAVADQQRGGRLVARGHRAGARHCESESHVDHRLSRRIGAVRHSVCAGARGCES